MKHLKSYKIFEELDTVKSDLEDIFLEVKDNNPNEGWFYWVEGDDLSKLYEVYISFGDEEPYHDFEDEAGENQISESLVEVISRSVDYMKSLGWKEKILFVTEYSSDPSEDYVEEVDIDDIRPGQWMRENEAIRIKFRKI